MGWPYQISGTTADRLGNNTEQSTTDLTHAPSRGAHDNRRQEDKKTQKKPRNTKQKTTTAACEREKQTKTVAVDVTGYNKTHNHDGKKSEVVLKNVEGKWLTTVECHLLSPEALLRKVSNYKHPVHSMEEERCTVPGLGSEAPPPSTLHHTTALISTGPTQAITIQRRC